MVVKGQKKTIFFLPFQPAASVASTVNIKDAKVDAALAKTISPKLERRICTSRCRQHRSPGRATSGSIPMTHADRERIGHARGEEGGFIQFQAHPMPDEINLLASDAHEGVGVAQRGGVGECAGCKHLPR